VLDRELLAPATGAPNVQIWVFNAVIVIKPASMQNGGSRAMAVASDHHAARPAFESVSEPSAE